MEVMGLMLGDFVDEYTVRVVDVFAMPQSGTGVSVEAVDHVFQTNMLDMLKQTGRSLLSYFHFFYIDITCHHMYAHWLLLRKLVVCSLVVQTLTACASADLTFCSSDQKITERCNKNYMNLFQKV